jgi:hypothetical protein
MPFLVETCEAVTDAARFLQANRADLDDLLLTHGAILFRGFGIASVDRFSAVVDALKNQALAYEYRSTPREKLGRDIYTASEYPAKHAIPMHCENAYQQDWPTKLLFACTQPSETGGQTPLADMVGVTKRLSPACLDAFAKKGVCYVRNYHDGIDLSWQNVFQTESRDEVDALCRRMNIDFEWVDDERLRTKQVAQGVARHHSLDLTLFFNQASLFHVSSLGEETAASMMDSFDVDDLPRHACFGDMTQIPADYLAEIRAAYDAEKIFFDWQKGDFVLVDNMQVAHGREPFTGQRQILASLCDPYLQRIQANPPVAQDLSDRSRRIA